MILIFYRKKLYGGEVYEKILSDAFPHAEQIIIKKKRKLLSLFVSFFLNKNVVTSFRLLPFLLVSTLFSRKYIVILHHLELDKPYHRLCLFLLKYFFAHKTRIVVPSHFWENNLKQVLPDFTVHVIHNPTDLSTRDIGETVSERNFIHVGPPLEKKGISRSTVLARQHFDKYNFVSTGVGDFDLTQHTDVEHKYYNRQDLWICLKNCKVMFALSEFPEGWNRLIFEALMLNVPVISNGSGGMMEVLRLFNQIPYDRAQDNVEEIYQTNKKNLEKVDRLELLERFSKERFISNWSVLMEKYFGN